MNDDNFDPFATKTKVSNGDQEVPKPSSYNVDFLDKLDDPNFNPFETKTKVMNEGRTSPEGLPPLELCEKPKTKQVKDSTPEFEQAEKLINDEPFNKLEQLIKENSSSTEPLEKITSFDDRGSDLTEPTFILSASKDQDLFTSNDNTLNFEKEGRGSLISKGDAKMEPPKSIPEKRIHKGMK